MEHSPNKDQLLEMKKVVKGRIPWNLTELKRTLHWHEELLATPKDDWQLACTTRFFEACSTSGDLQPVTLSPFSVEGQLAAFFKRRYSRSLFPHRYVRYTRIVNFLCESHPQMVEDGFLSEFAAFSQTSDSFLAPLCFLQFSIVGGHGDSVKIGFRYRDVLEAIHLSN